MVAKKPDAYTVHWWVRDEQGRRRPRSRHFKTLGRARNFARRIHAAGYDGVHLMPMEWCGFYWSCGARIPFEAAVA